MLSGGADSVCLLDVACGSARACAALHVNYGLRDGAAERRAPCRGSAPAWRCLCVSSAVGFPRRGNLQARAARRATAPPSDSPPATTPLPIPPPTRPRRCSTAWPCRRAGGLCLAWPPRRGRLVRPLLDATRGHPRPTARSMGWPGARTSPTSDPRFARARVRHELLAGAARGRAGCRAHDRRDRAAAARRGRGARRRRWHAALAGARRRARAVELGRAGACSCAGAWRGWLLRALAGGRRPVAARAARVAGRCARWAHGGTRSLDLGGGLRAVAEYGTLRFRPGGARGPSPWRFPPGQRRGSATGRSRRAGRCGRGRALRRARSGSAATVRAWRDGDRMRPRRPGRHEVPPGPLHRPQGPSRAAALAAGGRGAGTRSPGWPAWRSTSASRRPRPDTRPERPPQLEG